MLLAPGQRVRAIRARSVQTQDDSAAGRAARAFGVRGERVEAYLDDAEFEARRSEAGDGAGAVLDVPDLFVVPGFIDSHIHVHMYGEHLENVDLTGCASIGELQARLRARAASSATPWICGFGWEQDLFAERRMPTRRDLDAAVQDRPCFLWRACFHVAACNSAALAAAGIDAAGPPDPPGGSIDRDPATSEPLGLLREWAAVELVKKHVPAPSPEQRLRYLEVATAKLARAHRGSAAAFRSSPLLGVTSVQTNDGDGARAVYEALRARRAAAGRAPPLPLRVYLTPMYDELEGLAASGARTGQGDDWLRWGRVKIFADGSLGARARALRPFLRTSRLSPLTAALEAPYADAPAPPPEASASGHAGGAADECCCSRGLLLRPASELHEAIRRAHGAGWALETHAIGDRAAEAVISGWAEQRLGPERMETAYAWRTLLEAGVHCAGGSDAPVESPDPMLGMHTAINRQDAGGRPEGGWRPQEKLSPAQALRLFTEGGAYAEFAEGYKGRLAPGYLADFVLLDRDPLLESSYPGARVLLTVAGGVVTHAAGQEDDGAG
eukprot:tig00020675_g12660.t1